MKSDYEEVSILTDDDLSTCETGKNTMDLFGLFLEHHLQRIIVSLVGHDMCCSPANGIMVTIVSTSQESKICQATFSHYSDRCRYRCFCVNTVTYSHIAISVPANGSNICEIIIDWFEIRLHILKKNFATGIVCLYHLAKCAYKICYISQHYTELFAKLIGINNVHRRMYFPQKVRRETKTVIRDWIGNNSTPSADLTYHHTAYGRYSEGLHPSVEILSRLFFFGGLFSNIISINFVDPNKLR